MIFGTLGTCFALPKFAVAERSSDEVPPKVPPPSICIRYGEKHDNCIDADERDFASRGSRPASTRALAARCHGIAVEQEHPSSLSRRAGPNVRQCRAQQRCVVERRAMRRTVFQQQQSSAHGRGKVRKTHPRVPSEK
ncbi:hypothetical protein B0H14DRAFT_3136255 [Mycena olivaceomarginata]|nr:hypothetical protein B0H14DRAFT_3136255 [Mycena olivaceomarginata]